MTYQFLTRRQSLYILVGLVLTSTLAVKAQDAASSPPSSIFQDGNRIEEAKNVIRKATADRQADVLIDALHGSDRKEVSLAFDGIGSLPKPQQARVLARLLLDNSLIDYGDDLPPIGGSAMRFMQTALQNRIEQLSYNVLGGKPPARERWFTRAQAAALAARLNAIN